MTVSEFRAAEGATSHDDLASLMAVQRSRFAPAQRPVLPEPGPVDPLPIVNKVWKQRKHEAKVWQRGRRKELRAEVNAFAQTQADQLLAQAQAQQRADQQRADKWWAALNAGDSKVVTAALQAAFADNPAPVTVLSVSDEVAFLIVWLPGIDVLPDRKAHITPGGRLSSKAWTKTELNDVYTELLGAHLLATLRETWAVAPSITRARVVGVVKGPDAARNLLFDVSSKREWDGWQDDEFGSRLLATSVGLERAGRAREVRSLPPDRVAPDLVPILKPQS